jgi:hypothetical protein
VITTVNSLLSESIRSENAWLIGFAIFASRLRMDKAHSFIRNLFGLLEYGVRRLFSLMRLVRDEWNRLKLEAWLRRLENPQSSTTIFAFISPYTVGMQSRTKNTHRVLMNFQLRHGWHVSFLEEDCKTSLPLKLTFATPDKLRTMHQRFGAHLLEDRQGLEHAITIGRGSTWLTLDEEQYRNLHQHSSRK